MSRFKRIAHATANLFLMLVLFWHPMQSQAFETHKCTEKWYNQSIKASHHNDPVRVPECRKAGSETKQLSWYRVIDNKAYWLYTNKERHSPCSGREPGALGNLLNPVCYLPEMLQVHQNDETREYFLVSQDGDHFGTAITKQMNLKPWQKNNLSGYAKDSTSVYYNSEKIEKAAPKSFEVIFPFGDDPKWNDYSFARDGKHLFVDGWVIPNIDLDRVVWLDLSCSAPMNNCDTTYKPPSIGQVGQDVLFLKYGSRATVFRNLAKPDLACSRREYSGYCISGGKLYEIVPDFEEEAKLVSQDLEPKKNMQDNVRRSTSWSYD